MKKLLHTCTIAAVTLALTAAHSFASLVATTRIDSDWGSGFSGSVVLKNTGSAAIEDWSVQITMPVGAGSAAARDRLPLRIKPRKISSFFRVNSSSISVVRCARAVRGSIVPHWRGTRSRPLTVGPGEG